MKEKSSGKTMDKGSIQMIQKITNRTWKMNQDMKRKGIFFLLKELKQDGKKTIREASWP